MIVCAHRIFVRFIPVVKERDAYVKEVPHALMLMDVIQMTSGFVVRPLGLDVLAMIALFTLPTLNERSSLYM